MQRRMFLAKIHRATVTHADLDYEGSVSIDRDLMDAAGILDHEEVHVWNVTRGTRLVTYAIPSPNASGIISINGAAAHHNRPGDIVILATFGELTDEEARRHTPRVIRVDAKNRIVNAAPEVAGPGRPRR
jgi:aspartate 1-decarboxylase